MDNIGDILSSLSDDDMKALWAYVRSIPPIPNTPPANALEFPFNIRLGMLAWRDENPGTEGTPA